MKKIIRNFIYGVFPILITSCNDSSIEITKWVESTENAVWQERNYEQVHSSKAADIHIDINKLEQEIDGFGGCFNELGWDVLQIIDTTERNKILAELFQQNHEKGHKFNVCRMPIGANDFARDFYSLNDTPNDFNMQHFNVDRDKQSLIPYIKMALSYNPDLKIWGSPWCPPAWMKSNNHYACSASEVNDLEEEKQGEENHTQFKMQPEYLKAYALYFSKYIEFYKESGIDIYAVHVQNEPNSCQNFPSCVWTGKDLGLFISDYLGPVLRKNHPNVEIWLGTIERPYIDRIADVLENTQARQYITGVGFQWAGRGAIPIVNLAYPDLKLMQTETECGNGRLPWDRNAQNDWAALEYTFSLMKHYFNNGANSYMYWNIVLNETGKSTWSWKQNSMITINQESKQVTYNPEFYLMKHFSHFIKPGARKIDTENSENLIAFLNPNGEIIILFNNSLDKPVYKNIEINGTLLNVQFKAKSLNTLILSN